MRIQNNAGGRKVEQLDFGEEDRYMRLDDKKDPLVKLNAIIPWELFRPRLRSVWREPQRERKPWDEIVMFKAIILCALYNLSDEQVEYQMLDRLSFTRFLGLELKDSVPDARTVWLYRNKLARAGVIEELFADFDGHLEKRGYKAMGGQIIDASIVSVPKQRNTRDENEKIRKGETPGEWKKPKRAQKDTDARWTKKRGTSYYGYKNHVNVDAKNKLIRNYGVTDASVHDSRVFEEILMRTTAAKGCGQTAHTGQRRWRRFLKRGGTEAMFTARVHGTGRLGDGPSMPTGFILW